MPGVLRVALRVGPDAVVRLSAKSPEGGVGDARIGGFLRISLEMDAPLDPFIAPAAPEGNPARAGDAFRHRDAEEPGGGDGGK
jgi:hypothetical protein